jgi:DNA-binding LytR/AlgR family response regulator
MTAIKILVVENDMITSENISSKLEKAGYVITTRAANAPDALKSVKNDEPDLVIMDIHIDGPMDGIDTVKEIKKTYEVPVIFLTDLDNEKVIQRAAATRPAAYLLKPFNERQLIASIHQALHNTSHSLPAKPTDKEQPAEDQYVVNDCLFIRVENSHFKKILLKDILFIEADGAYSNIHTVQGDKHTYTTSMNHVHDKISRSSFMRVSRSFVVNLEKVDEVRGNMLVVNNTEIQIGEKYRDDVMKALPMLR